MKFTDKYFEFPIMTYDGMAIRGMMFSPGENEDAEDLWIEGNIRIPLSDVMDLKWMDYFSEQEGGVTGAIERAKNKEKIFDCTLVQMKDGQDFVCPYNKKFFEKKLDEYIERIEKEGA